MSLTKKRISAGEFESRVRLCALQIWRTKEPRRTDENWLNAISLLFNELGCYPSTRQIRGRAWELWLQRKDSQATEDWLEAERFVASNFEVVA
jgi:hypothetical protein